MEIPFQSDSSADLLLVNPVAGGGRAVDVLPDLKAFAQARGWSVEFCVTESPEDLATKARGAAERGRKRIMVLGGDGTFQILLNALQQYPDVMLGVVPAGGGNDLAAALGLPPNPLEAAAMFLEGETCQLDAVRVRTADGKEWLYCGGGGVGLDAEAARYASGVYRSLRGRVRYLLAVMRALFRFHSVHARIRIIDGEPQQLEATALVVAVLNTPTYGAGIHLAPNAKTDDGKLDLVVVEDLSWLEIVALLPALMSRGELKTNRVRRFQVACVRIESDKPCLFHGDGELLGSTPVEVSVVPKVVRVLRARRESRS